MKKVIYTLSFVALCGLAAKAQSNDAKQQDPTKLQKVQSQPATTGTKTEGEPKTRMAITQKGLPASKSSKINGENKEVKPAENKGQPTTTTEKH